jgi:thiol:disulfide interchange protein
LTSTATAKVDPPPPIAWETSEPDAKAKAKRSGRPMIVYLRAAWAVASIQMENEVWSDARVIRAGRRFVPLMIDVTAAEGDAELYAVRYAIPTVPATVVLDSSGARVALLPGLVKVEALLSALEKASE